MMKARRFSLPFALACLVGLACLVLAVRDPGRGGVLRRWLFDEFQDLKPRSASRQLVRIVDIDETSLQRVGQWPWSRDRLAELIDAMRVAGARHIVLDVLLVEPDRTSPARALARWSDDAAVAQVLADLPDYDQTLAQALARVPTITGFVLTNQRSRATVPARPAGLLRLDLDTLDAVPTFGGATTALAEFEQAALGNGAVNLTLDGDGVIRQIPLVLNFDGDLYPSLSAEAARLMLDQANYTVRGHPERADLGVETLFIGESGVATDSAGRLWSHFSRVDTKRSIAAWRVLEGEAGLRLRDATVVVGSSAAGLDDLRLTPLGERIAGAEIQAQAIEQLVDGTYLRRPGWSFAAELLLMLLAWGLATAAILRLGAVSAAATAATTIAGLLAASWWAFSHFHWVLDPVWPVLCVSAVFGFGFLARWMQEERARRFVRNAFSSYISPNLVDYLITHPESLELGGARRECSFVSTDLANFVRLVEATEPAVAVAILNEYVAGMTKIVLDQGGTIDRVVGDAVSAMFSAPIEQPDHARRALHCALEMQRFSADFRARYLRLGHTIGRTRIGIHCGEVTVGNVGGDSLVDYRALGAAVNLASRLEVANKALGIDICVSGAIVDEVVDFVGRPVGDIRLAGLAEPLPAFEPLSSQRSRESATLAYLEAFAALREGQPEAEARLRQVLELAPDDPLAHLHLKRLAIGESGVVVDLSTAAAAARLA